MQSNHFKNGTTQVGGRDIAFVQVTIQSKFRIYVPESFEEDSNAAYHYSYFSNRGKSPLGIALKYTPISGSQMRGKMITNYLGPPEDCELTTGVDGRFISYRETVHAGETMSVYSMRFTVEADGGVLFGCFNTSNKYQEDWKPAILQMLESIEVVR